VVRVALLGPDGPTGTFTRWENVTIPWLIRREGKHNVRNYWITGNVGGSVANNLLAAGGLFGPCARHRQRGCLGKARLRSRKGRYRRCHVACFGIQGRRRVFVLVPPNFDPAPGFPEARATAASLKSALKEQIRAESYTCPRSAHKA